MFMQAMAPMAGQTMAHFGKPMLEEAAGLREDPMVRSSFTNGMLGGSAILLGTLLGMVFDAKMGKKMEGAKGYGPLIGAAAGAAVHSWMSGKTHGRKVAMGMTAGTLVPALPLVAAIGMKKKFDGPWPMLIGGVSAAILLMNWQKRQTEQIQSATMATLEAIESGSAPPAPSAAPAGTQPPPASMQQTGGF